MKSEQLQPEHAPSGRILSDRSRILALDTSTATMSIAVLEGIRPLGKSSMTALRRHSVELVPRIQELVTSLNLAMTDLQGIAVGYGPGSYTGVRIGVTVAKTLAWSLQIPVLGVSSLEALALGAAEEDISTYEAVGWGKSENSSTFPSVAEPITPDRDAEGMWIVPFMDARRGNVYTGCFESDKRGNWRRLGEDGVRDLEAWMEQLASRSDRPERIVMAGEEQDAIREKIANTGRPFVFFSRSIDACAVGQLGQRQWKQGGLEEAHKLAPNYTQWAEAEAKWMAQQQ